MVKHIVAWTFADEADGHTKAENVALIKEALDLLPDSIPGIVAFEVVAPQTGFEASFDLLLYSEFESRQALDNYIVHPEHQAVAARIGALRKERYCMDYDAKSL